MPVDRPRARAAFRDAAVFVVLAVFAAVAVAASPGEIPVTGRVLGPRGAPVAEAEVLLLPVLDPVSRARALDAGTPPKPAVRVLSDSQGNWRLPAPAAGHWIVRIQGAGFAPIEALLEPLVEPLDLPDATLSPDLGLLVKVVGPGGQPVPGARVHLASPAEPRFFRAGSSPWQMPERAALTDPKGAALLAKAEKENAVLTVSAPGMPVEVRRNPRGTALIVKLSAGIPRTVRVISRAGAPVGGAMIVAQRWDHPLAYTDASGIATLAVPSGEPLAVGVFASDGRSVEGSLTAAADEEKVEGGPGRSAKSASADGPAGASDIGRKGSSTPVPRTFVLPDLVTLKGRLIDARDRRAIPGGLAWVENRTWDASLSDASGAFTLRAASGETSDVLAGAPGYMPADPYAFVPAAAGARTGPTLALRPAASIEGMVLDGEGRPVAGAEASLDIKREGDRMIVMIGRPQVSARAVTSSRGTFRLSPVDPSNNYNLAVKAGGYAPARREVVGLEAGRTMGGLRIVLDHGEAVIGQVVDGDGNPLKEATVSLSPSRRTREGPTMIRIGGQGGGEAAVSARSDADGRFRIGGLAAGTCDLEVRRAGFARKAVPGIEIAKGAGPVDLGPLSVEPAHQVLGFVSAPDGTPIEGVEVALVQQGAAGPVMVLAGRPTDRQPPAAVSGPDGSFVVDGLAAGEPVGLSFTADAYLPAREGGIQVPRTEPVLVTLQPSSRVTGTVLDPDGKPIGGAEMNLTRSTEGGIGNERFRMITREDGRADDQGRFEFRGVAPGQITLSAKASGWQEAQLSGVEVPQGKDVEGLELPLERGAVITGRIQTPDGRPAIGARIGPVTDNPEPIRMGGATSDGDGQYRIEGLAPGRVSIEATHDDYVRTVKEIEARAGANTLNLQFQGGHEVSGKVTDMAGAPVPGAWVKLAAAGREWGGPETKAGAEGSFTLAGVGDGEYSVEAGREGFASSSGEVRVKVEGKPVQGLQVRLGEGGAIAGTVSGLDRAALAKVEIRALGPDMWGGPGTVRPDSHGAYRLEHLRPGSWTVLASIPESGRQARGQVTLEPGASEARADLQFGTGLTLSGRAIAGDAPVKGAVLFAQGTDINHSGRGQTGADGTFTIEGLESGTYRLELRQWETGLTHDETVEVTSSREVTLKVPVARIVGRVLDGADRRPLAGAAVTASRSGAESAPPSPTGARAATSDLNGRFEIRNVPDGTWAVSASRSGYAAATAEVAVDSGRDADGVTLTLDPTEGLTIEARLASGRAPETLSASVLDPGGRMLTGGSYATGENGRVRLTSVPQGSWDVVLGAAGAGTLSLRASVPGPPVSVTLPPACTLRISVPALAGEPTAATARAQDAQGRPLRALGWMGETSARWRLLAGRLELDTVPPGSWTVEVTASDGRTWSGTATVREGVPTDLELR